MSHGRFNTGVPDEPGSPPYRVLLDETDWGALHTAFGSGEDLPDILLRLLEPDPAAQVAALSELGELGHHQNTIYEAAAPAVMYVAGILDHPVAKALRPYRSVPVRAAVLYWPASATYDASDETVARIEQYCPGFLTPGTTMAAFRELRPTLYQAVAPFLQDSHEDVREAAVSAALVLAEHAALAAHRDHLAEDARRILGTSSVITNRRIAWRALAARGRTPLPQSLSGRNPGTKDPTVMAEEISSLPSDSWSSCREAPEADEPGGDAD
ncbi:hypothetical protein ABZ819_31970 [Streptomyces venezuelae]|uniref:hypothetical protein n=1 Tax=Streptomyces venezuelae TaxID=54571 RepID=UPI003419C40A